MVGLLNVRAHGERTGLGRHTTNLTVFADATGDRTRALRIGVRTAAAALVAVTVLVLVSLLNGVPMPGFTRPVRLPSQHPAGQLENQHTGAGPTQQGALAASSSPAVPAPGADPTSTPQPTSPAALPTATLAQAATTPRASAPSSTPGRTRGNKPPTPPGHTRHP